MLTAGKDVREPSNWFIYFGIEEVIRSQFFTNPEFCRQRDKFRGAAAPGSSMWKGGWDDMYGVSPLRTGS